jgi:hypothetical protein
MPINRILTNFLTCCPISRSPLSRLLEFGLIALRPGSRDYRSTFRKCRQKKGYCEERHRDYKSQVLAGRSVGADWCTSGVVPKNCLAQSIALPAVHPRAIAHLHAQGPRTASPRFHVTALWFHIYTSKHSSTPRLGGTGVCLVTAEVHGRILGSGLAVREKRKCDASCHRRQLWIDNHASTDSRRSSASAKRLHAARANRFK